MMRTAFALVVLAAALPACGPGRTVAATQPSPAAFDPAASDPDALALVDAAIAELGGAERWEAAKQVRFTLRYLLDGELKGWYVHHWDRWNGRHNYRVADLAAAKEGPDSAPWLVVFYDLFNMGAKPHASYGGREVAREDAARYRTEARQRLAEDAYWLAMVHKLRDPGVRLQSAEEMPEMEGMCPGGCPVVKVTFDPQVGTDTWYVGFDRNTRLPAVLQKQSPAGRLGFRIVGWQEADGLRFPTRVQNLGLEGEIFELSEIAISDPDDRLYIPQVTGH
jgi:hypothetical protein